MGAGRLAGDHRQGLMVTHEFDRDQLVLGRAETSLLVDLPDALDPSEVDDAIWSMSSDGAYVENRWERPFPDGSEAQVLAWGWVAGVLALAAVGIVIASAFATSARRQLVTIGQLSANGAPSPLVLRTLALQGSWTGIIGVAGALVVSLVGLVALRPVVEQIVGRSLGSYRFAVRGSRC
ncbi:MAG: hypothetical protein GX868_16900 [Actinobacteria bacterium]|nr:hypothetical protein [Actinomycetota bacterium]